jgi:two-component system NtrC family response regulator
VATLLVVDDEKKFLKILSMVLTEEDYEVHTAEDGLRALELFDQVSPNVVLTDLKMPGMGGEQLLREIKGRRPNTAVIILTAFGTVAGAVDAMRQGAFHYLLKPCNMDELKIVVRNALEIQQMALENQYLRGELQARQAFENIVGQSRAMQQVFQLIGRVADSGSTVLITGESGTGKELVARAIHRRSARAQKPFVPINCVAIPEELLESELFGHVKGAFTGASQTRQGRFELANLGTIFLDEIGDMSPRLQGKLLRVLQEKVIEPVGSNRCRKVDVRIVAATNADLAARVREGKFREDLFYRLNVVPIELPPLRERKEDIPLLVEHFLQKHKRGEAGVSLSMEAMKVLTQYHWPGNVRELENAIERVVVLGSDEAIFSMGLTAREPAVRQTQSPGQPTGFLLQQDQSLTYKQAKRRLLESFEREFFVQVLERAGGNVSEAARLAGMHRKNFYQKLESLDLNPKGLQS